MQGSGRRLKLPAFSPCGEKSPYKTKLKAPTETNPFSRIFRLQWRSRATDVHGSSVSEKWSPLNLSTRRWKITIIKVVMVEYATLCPHQSWDLSRTQTFLWMVVETIAETYAQAATMALFLFLLLCLKIMGMFGELRIDRRARIKHIARSSISDSVWCKNPL